MERIVRAQALGDTERAKHMRGQRTLEINPRHPLVKELRARFERDENDTAALDTARVLYEACLMESGEAGGGVGWGWGEGGAVLEGTEPNASGCC